MPAELAPLPDAFLAAEEGGAEPEVLSNPGQGSKRHHCGLTLKLQMRSEPSLLGDRPSCFAWAAAFAWPLATARREMP